MADGSLPVNTLSIDELLILCGNLTGAVTAAPIADMTSDDSQGNNTSAVGDASDLTLKQKDALTYIIVVLGFYSFGVILMVISYLKRERKELEEEKTLEDFFRYRPQTPREQRSKVSGRLALSAFNAANLITQPLGGTGRITFV